MENKTKEEGITKTNLKIAACRLLKPFTYSKLEELYLRKSEFYSYKDDNKSKNAYKKAILLHCKYDGESLEKGADLFFAKGMYSDAAELYLIKATQSNQHISVQMVNKAAKCHCGAAAKLFFSAMDGYYNLTHDGKDWWADYQVTGYFGSLLSCIKDAVSERADWTVQKLCKDSIFKQSPIEKIRESISESVERLGEGTPRLEKFIFRDILKAIEESVGAEVKKT